MGEHSPRGSVYVEVRAVKRVALSRIVAHWTREEAAALVRGDEAARRRLADEAITLALREPDDADLKLMETTFTAEVAHG